MSDDHETRSLNKLDLLETLPAHASGGIPEEAADLDFGGKLGRYLVLDRIGKGGMGVVYAAYDPVLDRRIAVKLLRAGPEDEASAGRARMEREAQALAKLSHANVIPVHDVGERDGQMYIAMELVEGATLRDWQKGKPWREVLGAYLSAARGLAAAHEAGIVHRDFKPDNVLVGNDGRVRVTDFGLARRAGDAAGPATAHSPIATSPAFSSDLTAAGAVMGTLAYMALEQMEGNPVDERSDQCSWCIAAWEGIFGEQPFVTGSFDARKTAMKTATPTPPAKSAVPRSIVRALQRGLVPEASARWPSMRALLDALERAATSRRWLVSAGGFAAIAVVAGVYALGQTRGEHRVVEQCASAATGAAWTPDARMQLEQAFAATAAPFARDAAVAIERALDAWAARWQHIATASCTATRIQRTQSEQTLDLRSACLARERDELVTTLAALGKADRKLVEGAAGLTLPDLDACNDIAALAGVVAPPRDTAERDRIQALLEPLEQELARGLPLGRAKELADTLEPIASAATKLAWPPLVARVRRDVARIDVELGKGKDARAARLAAAANAAAAGDADALVEIYIRLANLEAQLTSDFALGESWVELARGTLAHLGPRPQKQVELATETGFVAERGGHMKRARAAYEQALAQAGPLGKQAELAALIDLGRSEVTLNALTEARGHLERAQSIAKAELGSQHPMLARVEHDLATVVYREGKYAEAVPLFEAALAIRTAAYGADSVEVANTTQALGNVEVMLDHPDQAKQHFETSIRLWTARLGPDAPEVADAYNDIGGTYHRAGDYEKALANGLRVLAMREKRLGPDHPDVGESLVNTAIEAKNLDKWGIVDANYPRALAIFEKAYGTDSIDVAILEINLGEARRAQGNLTAAQAAYERAQANITKQLGADHPLLAHVWNGLGQLELARGHDARPLLEQAVAMREKTASDATDLAESRFALARALPAADAAHAIELATQARDVYAIAGAGYAKRHAAIVAWLTQHSH
ncbi:MAG: serine/threonine-protein kinase [Kofleriaceae bacterium]